MAGHLEILVALGKNFRIWLIVNLNALMHYMVVGYKWLKMCAVGKLSLVTAAILSEFSVLLARCE